MSLNHHHRRLGQALERHQEALIGLDLPDAAEHLRAYCLLQRQHLEWENTRLFPLFEALVAVPPRGCTREILDADHRKVEAFLDELEARFEVVLATEERTLLRRATLTLLEREFRLQNLLEHHELREESLLEPCLVEALGMEAYQAVLEELEQRTEHLGRRQEG